MKLLAFPCSKELVAPFCRRIDAAQSAAIILEKQMGALGDVLSSLGIRDIYVIPEDFYGRVTSSGTRAILSSVRQRGFRQAFFPLNDCCGNVAVMLSALAPEVIAVNATSEEYVELRLPAPGMDWRVDNGPDRAFVSDVQSEIVQRLKSFAPRIESLADGERVGEKPTAGLMANFPYDSEVLSRYSYAGGAVRGRVLEVGCGLGYGAYMMVRLNPAIHVTAVDADPAAVEVAQELWGADDRLKFAVARAEDLSLGDASFDSAVCFEVIEHLSRPERLLEEVGRALAAGGKFIGSTPNSRLFPYRVNKGLGGTPEELRQAGVWPWHVQEFDEKAVAALMERFGYGGLSIGYPTYTAGINQYNVMRNLPFAEAVEQLSSAEWSAADFAVLDRYYPCFSGYSFVFSGTKDGAARGSGALTEGT